MILFGHPIRMFSACRLVSVATLVVVCCTQLTGNCCYAQPPDSIDLKVESPERRQILRYLAQLEDIQRDQYLQAADAFDAAWALAVLREDPLLNLNTDLQQVLQPGQSQLHAGARAKLQQVFETAPAEFREIYGRQMTSVAQHALDAAIASGSVSDLTQVILRYQFTEAGQQALEHLIALRRSHGEFLETAVQYRRLLRLREDESAEQQVRLAILWWRAGLPEEAIDTLRMILPDHDVEDVVVFGSKTTLPDVNDDLQSWLRQVTSSQQTADVASRNWLQPLGNYRRNLSQGVGPSQLETNWSDTTFSCIERTAYNPMLKKLADGAENLIESKRQQSDTVIPVGMPLLADNLVIFRTATNIRAVDRSTGECVWETFHIDRQMAAAQNAWQSEGGELTTAFGMIQDQLVHHWLRANAGGQLTCDGRTVFAVEDSTQETMDLNLVSRQPKQLKATNYLRAYDLASGLTRGQAGGPIGATVTSGRVNPLAGMYFLGAPLVMGDRIYVIAESDQGIFLLQLRATPLYPGEHAEADMRPVRSQLLSIPRHVLRIHPLRKYAGIIPSYGRGLLICNTCDEQITAVSADDHSVRWTYRYPTNVTVPELNQNIAVIGSVMDLRESNFVDMAARWTDCLPRIVGDRVLVTPRDCDRLLCLEIETGKEIWSRPRGSHRTIAATSNEHVILAGTSIVECLTVADGRSVWRTEINDASISGTCASNQRTLQVPTSEPSIVTLDLLTGRRLLTQPLDSTPGNLLSHSGQLISQTVTSVMSLQQSPSDSPSPLTAANQQFLSGDIEAGEESLRQIVATGEPEAQESARERLIESLMEGVRLQYAESIDHVTEIEALIQSTEPDDAEIAEIASAMLGLTLADAATLPDRWETIHHGQQTLRDLQALVADGQLQNIDESPDVLAATVLKLLDAAFLDRASYSRSGNLQQVSYRVSAAKIRTAMDLRTEDALLQIGQIVNEGLLERVHQSESESEVRWWLEIALLTGFNASVIDATASAEIDIPEKRSKAIRQTALLLQANAKNNKAATQVVETMIDEAKSSQDWLPLADIVERTLGSSRHRGQRLVEPGPSLSVARYGVLSENETITKQLQALETQLKDRTPLSPWQGKPVVTESGARSVTPMLNNDAGAVLKNLPFYGTPGIFGGWEFLMTRGRADEIQAFDQAGRPRWTIRFPESPVGSRRRTFEPIWSTVTAKYVLAWGHLLAIKLDHELSVFDCSQATRQQPPRLLWKRDIRAFTGQLTDSQRMTRGYERTTQFDMQPSGLFPVGPLTPHGIPIYGGQRTSMLNAFTGQPQWQIRGVARDCRMTATDDHLLLISESTAQVEVRNLIDGSLQRVTTLADWWTDASENSGSSVYTFEPEDGEDLRWRIAVLDGQCLIHRRNTKAAALESHDLSTNEQSWSIPLPADSIVSNIVNGHVAVLCDTNRLQIYDLTRCTITADVEVPEAIEGTYLYLRNSGEHWVAITNTVVKDSDKVYPVQESVDINGHVYAVRQSDGSLTWTAPTKRQWLRTLRAVRGPLPPTAPFLTLLQRWYPQSKAEGLRRGPIVYRATVLDSRTGEVLYEDGDVGMGLSYLWNRFNPDEKTIELNFDKRVITFDYNDKAEDTLDANAAAPETE